MEPVRIEDMYKELLTEEESYSYLIDLAGWMCEMRKLGITSMRMQRRRVTTLIRAMSNQLNSTGTVLT